MSDSIYHDTVMELARSATGAGLQDKAAAEATIDNPLCGDRITLQIDMQGSQVAAVRHKVRGCALCEASAALIAGNAAGMDRPAVPDKWWISNSRMRGLRKGPEDNWHHEAFHDASTRAAASEFMPQPYKAMYQYFSLAKGMGIRIEEALAQYHDMIYPKSLYAAESSKEWLEDATQEAENESLNMSNSSQEQRVWGLYLKTLQNLGMMYDAILGAARKRHESLGYK